MESRRFSQRMGYMPARSRLQIEEMDEQLRNRLWNLLKQYFWDRIQYRSEIHPGRYLSEDEDTKRACEALWHEFFKQPLDTLSDDWGKVRLKLREYFFGTEWYEAYDFIEFVAAHYAPYYATPFMAATNKILEHELSAYRFVDGLITRIIEQEEIASIEEATEVPQQGPRTHIRRALELLSDRQQPDYRNSVKESISAVEALCKQMTGDDSATLSKALKSLRADDRLHPALRSAFESLYGYAGDAGGVRHALLEASEVGFDEAKFMLVACSAFVNFLNSKFGLSNST